MSASELSTDPGISYFRVMWCFSDPTHKRTHRGDSAMRLSRMRYSHLISHRSCISPVSTVAQMGPGLRVNCLLLKSDLYKILMFRQILVKIPKYEISRKSVRWEKNCRVGTGGRTAMTRLVIGFSLGDCAQEEVQIITPNNAWGKPVLNG